MGYVRLAIDPRHPEPRKVARAVEMLHDGAVAAYPTDTVYALGCAIDARKAVERIQRARRMDERQRLALIFPDLSAVARFAHLSQLAHRVARRTLPGPYTLVLPATREVPKLLMEPRRRTVGVRIPAHPVTAALVAALGRPLLTTSAVAPDADAPCRDAAEVVAAFGPHLDLVVDGGDTPGEPSTVLNIDDDGVTVLRHGLGAIEGVLD